MLLHDPSGVRSVPAGGGWSRAVGVGSGQIIQALIAWLGPATVGTDAVARLRLLGQELVRLAGVPHSQLEETVRELIAGHLRRIAAVLEERLQSHGSQPDYWAADVREVLGLLSPESVGRLAVSPADLAEAFGPDTALLRLRSLLRELGSVLAVWPEMVAAARRLRTQGVRPARLICPVDDVWSERVVP